MTLRSDGSRAGPQPTLWRNEIADLGRRLQELGRLIFHNLVGHGHARLAVFEFERGVDEEGLDHLPDLVRVLENVPGVGAVAPALEADIAHHREERGVVLLVDQKTGDTENWALIVGDPIEEGRRAP